MTFTHCAPRWFQGCVCCWHGSCV